MVSYLSCVIVVRIDNYESDVRGASFLRRHRKNIVSHGIILDLDRRRLSYPI